MNLPGVLIVTGAGSFTPAARVLTGPVDSIDKLEKLIIWASEHGHLEPGRDDTPAVQSPPRIWIAGEAACRQLADAPQDNSATVMLEAVGRSLAGLVARGWGLQGEPGGRFVLGRDQAQRRIEVEVLVEPSPWIAAGTDALDDAELLGARLRQWGAALEALPAASPQTSAAVVGERIMAIRAARPGRGAVVTDPAVLPAGIDPDVRIQPTWTASRDDIEAELDSAAALVRLEQERPELASAGMIVLGYGQPSTLTGPTAAQAAAAAKRPYGLWHATLPAGNDLSIPVAMPLPHPLMRDDEPIQAWLTSEDLEGLSRAVRDGGAALMADALHIDAAVVWPGQGRVLEAWATRMREARETVADDPGAQEMFERAAADYIAALADPAMPGWHAQRTWAASIAAHIRYRGRRAAMRISREYRLWPIYVAGPAMVYAPPIDPATNTLVELADTHKTSQGRLVARRQVDISDDIFLAVAVAETADQLAAAIATAVDIPDTDRPAAEHPAAAEQSPPQAVAAQQATPSGAQACAQAAHDIPDQEPVVEEMVPGEPAGGARPKPAAAAAAGKKRGSAGSAKPPGGVPAAVLDTDGLYFPDGHRVGLPDPLHVGHVAELAYEHKVGFWLSSTFVEAPQIWITESACVAFGVDVEAISRTNRTKSLRQLTSDIEFVVAAREQGWQLGGTGDDPQAQGLGTWTRVYRDEDRAERRGVMIALIPGMDTGAMDMPILTDNPSAAQLARRLHLLADALGFPWKISGQTTGLDLLKQARPQTTPPRKWIDVILAPVKSDPPYGVGDVQRDFSWCREPTTEEAGLQYVHAYDRSASYPAAWAGLELPLGEPVHHPDGIAFDPKVVGCYLLNIPDAADWRLPHLLNPGGRQFTEPKLVCSPALVQAAALGYEPDILEALTWPEHGRYLLRSYERYRDASNQLDTADPDAQAARNQTKIIRTRAFGMLASPKIKGQTCYNPWWWLIGVSKANANIIYRVHQIGERRHCWPLAVDHDTILYASDDPDPVSAWPGERQNFGRGFGQYKPEGSALLADHVQFLGGGTYKGKGSLVPPQRWREEMMADADGGR